MNNPKAKEVLRRVEESVKTWFQTNCGHKRIGVSLQPYGAVQGSDRWEPGNSVCRRAYAAHVNNENLCDLSDLAMKWFCKSKGDNFAIAYRCHAGMSNIVIPFHDHEHSGAVWYLFLGQFVAHGLKKCAEGCVLAKGEHCPAANRMLDEHEVVTLDENHVAAIPDKLRASVKPGFIGTQHTGQDHKWTLGLPEIIVCRERIDDLLRAEFSKAYSASAAKKALLAYARSLEKLDESPRTGAHRHPTWALTKPLSDADDDT